MSDSENRESNPAQKTTPEPGTIINAAAHSRPRIHEFDSESRKGAAGIDFVNDIPLKLEVILGETTMSLREISALEAGSIVQMGKPSGDPMDIYVEDQKLGRGEVIVLHEKIRIRLLEITPSSEDWEKSKPKKTEER